MPLADLKLARIYYESSGSGPPLVFAHGAGGNALSWWQQTAFFGARYRCITFDHPGFRHSKWIAEKDDPDAIYGNVLLELLEHLEIETVGLVAQSMGGWTCLRFALDHPDRVQALVMAATDGGLYLPSLETYSGHEVELAKIRTAWEKRQPGCFHPAAGSRMLREQPDLHDMYVEIGSQNSEVSNRGWGEIRSKELSALRCPVLLVAGAEDVVCPTGRLQALHDVLTDSQLTKVQKAGHSVYFERAELFNRTVDEFLSKTYPAGQDGQSIVQSFTNRD